MDESAERNHCVKGCRLVFPGDHVGLLEGSSRYKTAGAFYLNAGNVNSEHVEVLFNEELGRGNSGAASEIENSGSRPQQPRQIIDPSRVLVRTFIGRGVCPTVIVTVCARDSVVATANKIAPARS